MIKETGGNWNDSLGDRKKKNVFLKTSSGAGGEIFFYFRKHTMVNSFTTHFAIFYKI